jgi:hypothetical protein
MEPWSHTLKAWRITLERAINGLYYITVVAPDPNQSEKSDSDRINVNSRIRIPIEMESQIQIPISRLAGRHTFPCR